MPILIHKKPTTWGYLDIRPYDTSDISQLSIQENHLMCCNCQSIVNVYFDQIATNKDVKFSDAFNSKSVSEANISDITTLAHFLMMNSHFDYDNAINRIVEHLNSGESKTLKQVVDWIKRYWM